VVDLFGNMVTTLMNQVHGKGGYSGPERRSHSTWRRPAGAQITFNVAKANADSITHANDARMEAAKVGLATGAQRLASAWSMVSANAGVTDNTNLNISV